MANLGDADTRDPSRDALAAGCGEEQFVILAPVQCELKIDFVSGLADLCARNRLRLDLRANPALFADVPEIGGKAVAEIDHGRSETFFEQEPANFDPGRGMEVAGKIGWPKFPAGE